MLETTVMIPVENLRLLCNPFEDSPWGAPISVQLIDYCLRNNLILEVPVDTDTEEAEWGEVNAHLARIAFLVKERWKDPIEIDVGVPSLGCHVEWPIIDGNHRFAAVLYLGETTIEAEVSGQVDYAERLLGCSLG